MDPIDYFISFPNESDFFAIHMKNINRFKQKINHDLLINVSSKNTSKDKDNV